MVFKKVFGRFFPNKELSLKHVFGLFSFIFVVWAVYRYFPEILPSWAEELILKPAVWLIPTFWVVKKIERQPLSSLGYTTKNLFPSLYWGSGLGMVFALEGLLTNILKYRGLRLETIQYNTGDFFGALFLSFATAASEETVFRGYIFNRLWKILKTEWGANVISAFLFMLIHLPISVFVLSYTPQVMLVYLFLVFVYGVGSAFVFARSKNIVSAILLHVFWSWPIILFK
ncbi:MAG: lysostaphin resistance A-like protein [Microgenomates group bacterium]